MILIILIIILLCIAKLGKYYIYWSVKLLIALLCFAFLLKKIRTISFDELKFLLNSGIDKSWYLIILVFLLFFINWGIEAVKWQYLAGKIEKLSFKKSFLAVMGGVTVSTFTPNRTGEFAGRMIFLENKFNAGVIALTIFGSINQLLITVFAGLPGLIIFFSNQNAIDFIKYKYFLIIASVFLLAFAVFVLIDFKSLKTNFAKFINKYNFTKHITQALSILTLKDVLKVFLMSLFRYLVFLFQFYLVLKIYNISLDLFQIFTLLPTIFLIQTLIPSFLLSEIGVRLSVAVAVLSVLGFESKRIIASTISLWVVNIAMAALIGVFAILFFKFKPNK